MAVIGVGFLDRLNDLASASNRAPVMLSAGKHPSATPLTGPVSPKTLREESRCYDSG